MLLGGQRVTGGRREELDGAAREKAATLSSATQSRFHNFSFPGMSWGSQRILRCANSVSGIDGSTAESTPKTQVEPQNNSQTSFSFDTGVFKAKEIELEEPSSAISAASAKPWNLRTRRASCYAPSENGKNRYANLLLGKENPAKAGISMIGENEKRRRFSVSLSREEIEEDFQAFKGSKPHRRPKKRPKIVQKKLDELFPGLWLSEVTADDYKVVQ